MSVIERLRKLRNKEQIVEEPVQVSEDYSTNPVFPNDTSYVGFFFEKNINDVKVKQRFEEEAQKLLALEAEYREKYGEDWRNVAVHKAYRMVREEFGLDD